MTRQEVELKVRLPEDSEYDEESIKESIAPYVQEHSPAFFKTDDAGSLVRDDDGNFIVVLLHAGAGVNYMVRKILEDHYGLQIV